MIYYRVALQVHDSAAWKWKSTILTTLETLFRFLCRYRDLGFPNDRMRVFFASSTLVFDELLTRENKGAASNSMTVEQLAAQRWWINPTEIKRVESELYLQQNKGARSHVVLPEALVTEEPMGVPAMTQVGVDGGTGADHDLPYHFALPSMLQEALSWARLLSKVHAGELVPGD